MADFQRCVDFIIDKLEGGDTLVTDAGGLTRFGISSRAHPTVDVRNLTRADAERIYFDEYWEECNCDRHPWPLNLVVFDAAINQGVAFAQTLGHSALDYVEALLMRVVRYAEIVEHNKSRLPDFHGWIDRVVTIYRFLQL